MIPDSFPLIITGTEPDPDAAQEAFFLVFEPLCFWRNETDRLAKRFARMKVVHDAKAYQAAVREFVAARNALDAAFARYLEFRDAHPGEEFVTVRPDVAAIVDRHAAVKQAKLTRAALKQRPGAQERKTS